MLTLFNLRFESLYLAKVFEIRFQGIIRLTPRIKLVINFVCDGLRI